MSSGTNVNNFQLRKRREATYATGDSPNGSARYCYDNLDEKLAQFIPIIKAAGRKGRNRRKIRKNSQKFQHTLFQGHSMTPLRDKLLQITGIKIFCEIVIFHR